MLLFVICLLTARQLVVILVLSHTMTVLPVSHYKGHVCECACVLMARNTSDE